MVVEKGVETLRVCTPFVLLTQYVHIAYRQAENGIWWKRRKDYSRRFAECMAQLVEVQEV